MRNRSNSCEGPATQYAYMCHVGLHANCKNKVCIRYGQEEVAHFRKWLVTFTERSVKSVGLRAPEAWDAHLLHMAKRLIYWISWTTTAEWKEKKNLKRFMWRPFTFHGSLSDWILKGRSWFGCSKYALDVVNMTNTNHDCNLGCGICVIHPGTLRSAVWCITVLAQRLVFLVKHLLCALWLVSLTSGVAKNNT